MKITILDGQNSKENHNWAAYLEELVKELTGRGHDVAHFVLMDQDIHACTGCFNCWVKTPGMCVIADDSREINRRTIQSDFVLWASPLVMGYPSAYLKNKMDRTIPLLHPYFEIVEGETHHRKRYQKYPLLGLLYQPETDTPMADIQIMEEMFSRAAFNLRSRLTFSMPFSEKPSQVADAIDHAQALNYKPGMTAVTIPFARITPPKKLLVINGSPRVERSISAFLMNKFADGFQSVQGTSVEMIHLAKTKDKITLVQKYKQADCVMLAFPLYVDAMPGIVKEFIELLSPLAGREGNPPIGFLVQSGFPEAVHSRSVEKYLAQLTVRLNSPYLGTILRGGCGSVTIAPEIFNRRIFITLNELGEQLAQQGGFDPQTIRKFASLERFSKADVAVRKITSKTPLMQFYWQGLLRQNKAFDQRFNRPYLESDNVVEKIV